MLFKLSESTYFSQKWPLNCHINFVYTVITREAGKANLALKIASPTGRNVPYNINKMADGSGEVVEYVPMEPGPHQIYITYGDLDVAGEFIALT